MMEASAATGEAHVEVQLVIDQWVVMAREVLQLRSMRELMKKSWFRRYCSGDAREEVLGMRMMAGGEQPRSKGSCAVRWTDEMSTVLLLVMVDVWVVSIIGMVVVEVETARDREVFAFGKSA